MTRSVDRPASGRTSARKWMGAGIGLVAALAMTACGSPAPEAPGSASAPSGPVKLTYTIWDQAQKPAMQKIADAFTKENPNVTVEVSVTPSNNYWTTLETQIPAGSGPDVFWINGPKFQLYASGGAIAPLDDQGIDKANYPEALVNLYTFDGHLYAAPKDFDTIGVFYNKKLFDAAGVKYPAAGWTWDDFKNAAAKLTNKSKGIYGIASAPYGQMTWYNTVYQAGGEIINADHNKLGYDLPETAQGVQIWADFVKNGYSPTTAQMADTWPGDSLGSGKLAMFWDGSWGASGYAKSAEGKNIDVAPLPAGPKGNMSVIHGLGNVANAKSQHLAEAKKFAAFASGKEAADIMASTGTVIPAFNGTQETWVKAIPSMNVQSFLDSAKTAVPYPISKNTAAWNTVENDIMPKILDGKLSLTDGLAQLQAKGQAELAKE